MPEELLVLRTIANYQFGRGSGIALFPDEETIEIKRSASGRPRQVVTEAGRLVTLGRDGRFTLGFAGGRCLLSALDPPSYRVAVGDESEPFVCDGANAFAKFVLTVDPQIRPRDEVLIVNHEQDDLLAVGRAELSGEEMEAFDRGVAVSVREGRDEWGGGT